MHDTLIAVNNDKIRTIIKEIIYRSITDMLNKDANEVVIEKDGLVIQEKLKTIVNLVVDNNIVDMMNMYRANKTNEFTGKITYMLNSVFSAVDLDAVTINEMDGRISSVNSSLVKSISDRLYNELSTYKNIYLPSMRIVASRAKALMSELQHIDIDTLFKIEYAEEHYITEVMLNRGYGDDVMGGTTDVTALSNMFLKPLNQVDVYSTIKNTEYADLGMLLDELDTSGELGDIVEHINGLIKNDYGTVADLIKHVSNANIDGIKALTIEIIFFKHYIKNQNAMLRNGFVTLLKRANERLARLTKELNNFIEKDVLVYKTVKTGDEYTMYLVKENFNKLLKENDDVHVSDIFGYGVYTLSVSALNVNKLCTIDALVSDRNKFNEVYNKYINVVTTTNRLSNISDIRSIYSIAVRDVNTNIYNVSNVDSKNDIMDATLKIVNKLSLDVLLDPKKTSEIIFKSISVDTNNFSLFVDELNNAKKLIDDDVDVNTAIVYGSVCILSKYFVSMLKVI